ncbi:hypothetical protein C4K68_21245 [Pokkaliibacter plantistimulans]|uniref:Lipoprotein n=1 Tax=Proteobacteria bacterium 228 TaxID=2083153 RepID=A0A2S5KKB2_9PROT|nr:hypothetical protein [Pokkaliibacter plantistimulans]PPC75170.1 hypothetical protein C4K68_21245 [Pokkaliibacter plantistimulans]
MKTTARFLFATFVASTLLGGCAVQVGKHPSDTPPRLMTDPKDGTSQIWDRPTAFGPVPAELMMDAKAECATLDTDKVHYKAIGYHPHAMDAKGQEFPGGGYFCVRK